MTALRNQAQVRPVSYGGHGAANPGLHDLRFHTLLGEPDWLRLPQTVQERFSKGPGAGVAVTYAGEILESRRNRIGWLIAQACRLIGAPLPLNDDIGAPAVVTVMEDAASGGQFWTRMYGRRRGLPQVIHSIKRFAGPTGLEEYLGGGFGIALALSADDHGLSFQSDHYFLRVMGARFRLPGWLGPGVLTIRHIDRGAGRFAFILELRHPRFGELINQTGLFRERLDYPRGDLS